MKKFHFLVLAVSMILFVSGCAFKSQTVSFEPQVNVTKLDIGKGQKIILSVVDERDTKSLGHRGGAFGKGAEISTEQDVADIIYKELSDGLVNYNFVPVSEEEAPMSMKAELRLLEYSTSTGFWTGGVHTKSAMKVICSKGAEEFEEIYRVENEKRVVFVPGADKNTQMINEMLSEILNKVLNDEKLIDFLKK